MQIYSLLIHFVLGCCLLQVSSCNSVSSSRVPLSLPAPQPVSIDIVIDRDLTDSETVIERALIISAAELSNQLPVIVTDIRKKVLKLPRFHPFQRRWESWQALARSNTDSDWRILLFIVPSEALSNLSAVDSVAGYAGQTGYSGATRAAAIAFTTEEARFIHTILHETGHLLGASHDTEGVMSSIIVDGQIARYSNKSRIEIIKDLQSALEIVTPFESFQAEKWDQIDNTTSSESHLK